VLQIIGWLGCLYLVVKALEIMSNSDSVNSNGKLKASALAACLLAWVGAVVFSLWIAEQGRVSLPAGDSTLSNGMTQQEEDCVLAAQTDTEILACR